MYSHLLIEGKAGKFSANRTAVSRRGEDLTGPELGGSLVLNARCVNRPRQHNSVLLQILAILTLLQNNPAAITVYTAPATNDGTGSRLIAVNERRELRALYAYLARICTLQTLATIYTCRRPCLLISLSFDCPFLLLRCVRS